MTQEEKAKAYDEALERANKQRADYQKELDKTDKNSQLAGLLRAGISAIDMAFPELRESESEDERIRKALVWHLKADVDFVSNGVTKAECLSWLEKQKEQSLRDFIDDFPYSDQKERKPELVQHPPITYTYNSNASREERLKAALLALLNSDLLKVKEGGYFTKQDLIEWVERIPTDKPAEWSEEDEKLLNYAISMTDDAQVKRFLKSLRHRPHKEIYQTARHDLAIKFMNYLDENRPEGKMGLSNGECEDIDKAFKENDWAKIMRYVEKYRPQPKQEWSEEERQMFGNILNRYSLIKAPTDGNGISKERYIAFIKSFSPSWKPSEKKKKETLDGADIGYGLETAIDILENGFTHYQTDDGEYERKQALDVLVFLLNETRKKEDAKLWNKDIIESIVTWATEKLQLYSMKESTPYVEAVKNNAQKVLDWAKEQWPIYYGWKPTEEQMAGLLVAIGDEKERGSDIAKTLRSLYEQLKKL